MKYNILLALLMSGCSATTTNELKPISEPTVLVNESDWSYWKPSVQVAPVYPRHMNKQGKTGCVNVSYVITQDGSVSNPVVVKTSPNGKGFEKASIEAAMKFKYIPTESNHAREPVRTSNTFTYFLGSHTQETITNLDRAWREKCKVDLTSLAIGTF